MRAAQPLERNVADVDAVDEHRAGRRLVQPRQQADERRLARPRDADDRHGLSGFDPQADVRQHRRRGAGYVNIRSRISISPDAKVSAAARPRAVTVASLIAGSGSSTSSIRFHDAMPRCSMFVTHPNAIIGQLSIVR